ncbi:MAG: ABC transporter ATP-binding protein [Candidatus Latescibacterota bacterium]|nr:ABC transporter ATP-binding protein [Candidatus Latescibacterota bacterium]
MTPPASSSSPAAYIGDTLIRVESASRTYVTGEVEIPALSEVSLTVSQGEFTAVAGPSGSGKSTLLNLISGLDTPTAGAIYIAGRRVSDMTGTELSDFRRDHMGFIFQSYNLIPVLSVTENVEYIMLLQGVPAAERRSRVEEALELVALAGISSRRPDQLSGGQQQRVAIARAMVSQPNLILADEPTANLDSATGSALVDMMRQINSERGVTFLFSTHDIMIMERARRLVTLRDGRIDNDEVRNE